MGLRQHTHLVHHIINQNLKLVTMAAFLGFGLNSCASSDESIEDPVVAEESPAAAAVAFEGDELAGNSTEGESSETSVADATLSPSSPTGAENEAMEGDEAGSTTVDPGSEVPEFFDNTSFSEGAAPNAAPGAPEMASNSGSQDTGAGFQGADMLDATIPAEPSSGLPADMKPEVDNTTVSSPSSMKASSSTTFKSSVPADGAKTSASSTSGLAGRYVVQSGDTLSTIARKVFGNVQRWSELAQANQISAPYIIFPGDALHFDTTDPKAKTFAKVYENRSESTVTVQHGDTLSKIAQRVLGNANAWKVLLTFNAAKIQNPNRIDVGLVLNYLAPKTMVNTQGSNAPASLPVSEVADDTESP